MIWRLWCTACLLVWSQLVFALSAERFSEGLSIRPLRDGSVAARFSFKTTLARTLPRSPQTLANDDIPQHYTLFPLSLGQILREYAVTELHLSLNAGKWDYSRWGYPEDPGVAAGAELWAWMGDSPVIGMDERWKGLRNALSGLFCASLGQLDEQKTTSPSHAFRPEGSLPKFEHRHRLRHASLPAERVCTENLTPFLKLLPCKSASGLASLLNPHKLFDGDWHGMGIHVLWNQTEGVTVNLSFQAVMDPVRAGSQSKRDWSLRSLFDRSVDRACPAASESVVKVTLPKGEPYALTPEPTSIQNDVAVFNTAEGQIPLDISLSWALENSFAYPLEPAVPPLADLTIVRTLTGPTQSRGRLSVTVRNNLAQEVQAIYLETMPWLVQFYLHTLQLTVNGVPRHDPVKLLTYIPPEAHGHPMLFEALLTLPANSTTHFELDVTKAFMRYTEHPPDAQRGWDLPPAVLFPMPNASDISTAYGQHEQVRLQRIYTPPVLVDLATPDFSMPYNVIIMSSTLIALIFGSIFNLLTRKFVFLSSVNEPVPVRKDE